VSTTSKVPQPADAYPDTRWLGETPVGAQLLDDVHAFLARFVAYPSDHTHVAHTLWVAHAHLMEAWESSPRLAFLSPEPGSGKTRALEVTELLVPRPVESINCTPAYLFRKISAEEGAPTLLYDEIDTLFGPKAKDNEEIRGVLNAGHRRGAVAGRCVVKGKIIETEELPAFCAVALAGLGDLPETILTRSVIVRMRKRSPGEHVEPFRRRLEATHGEELHDRLASWADVIRGSVTDAWPDMPDGIEDRNADVWEALLAVADAAGNDWPGRARVAAVALVADSMAGTPSLGVLLLSDLRAIFDDPSRVPGVPLVPDLKAATHTPSMAIPTDDLLTALHALDESPWDNLRGSPLNARGLATRLRGYGIKPKQIRVGAAKLRGYTREDLHDAWERYLPVPLSEEASWNIRGGGGEAGNVAVGVPAYESGTSGTSGTAATNGTAHAPNWRDMVPADHPLNG